MGDLPAPLTSTIGNDELPFSGVFDGDSRIIRNFACTHPGGDIVGLFAQIRGNDALIYNIILADPSVEAETTEYVGVGALVGRLRSGTVTSCRIDGARVRGYSSVGALVDGNQAELSCREARGTVSGTYSVGGLAGNCALASIMWCSSGGSVEGYDYVGGSVGSSEGGIISNSYATSSVLETARVGGFLGQNVWSCDCRAGDHPSELTCCYAVPLVTGESQTGGFVGADDNCLVSGCFRNIETSGQSHSETGTPSTTTAMQTQETFLHANWDFTPRADGLDFWVIREGHGYPLPAWQSVEGDFDGDGLVDLDDFGTLASSWRTQGEPLCSGGCDLTGDAYTNARDLHTLFCHWLH